MLSSSEKSPRSVSIKVATLTMGFVIEAIRNNVSFAIREPGFDIAKP